MRAAAILMVIGFHAFPSMITGGYLGVDVFFVISGFLISRITIREMQDGTFTFYGFYSRRIRRIFPALALVISVTLLMGWRILLPKEYLSLGRHGLAGTSLIPNFLLQKESGYFDITIAQKPLGHLWSIGVEEQFYVLWPFLLLLTRKLRISALASVLVITALSLLQSLSVGREFSRAGYFLPQYRAWEIGIGCLLGIMNKEKLQKISDRQSDILSIAGAALVLTPLCTEKSLNVPSSIYSMGILSATFGTAALLISGEKKATFVRLILSHPWIVALGKISYSLYLWHWPMYSFGFFLYPESSPAAWAIAILPAFPLAILTHRFIESPARKKSGVIVCVLSMTLLAIMSNFVKNGKIHPHSERFNLGGIEHPDSLPPIRTHRLIGGGIFSVEGHGEETVLLLGDSNAHQYWSRIQKITEDHPNQSRRVYLIFRSACTPIPYTAAAEDPDCASLLSYTLNEILADESIKIVILASHWGRAIPLPAQNEKQSADALARTLAAAKSLEDFIVEIKKRGKRVVLVASIPISPLFARTKMIKRSLLRHWEVNLAGIPRAELERTQGPLRVLLRNIAKKTGAEWIDPTSHLCSESSCPTISKQGTGVYMDETHLSSNYVRDYVTFLDQFILFGQK